jgi:PhzF family phenazine biosynthesis protein
VEEEQLMVAELEVLRLAAFSEDPAGGNPAGVVVAEELPPPEERQRIAADVGYSETAFLAPVADAPATYDVRYHSPLAEVPFCGHATIAAGVVLGDADGEGTYELRTAVGPVPVAVTRDDGRVEATLTSVPPRQRDVPDEALDAVLGLLDWRRDELDDAIPPVEAFAGAWHLVVAVADRATLARLSYDLPAMAELMRARDLTTLQLVWREDATTFHARDPFPVGGVAEDPATGAAAAALGGYLRDAGLVGAPVELVVHQGVDLGRPSLLRVRVPETGGIEVSGTAVPDPV